jgi:hypothetical protein
MAKKRGVKKAAKASRRLSGHGTPSSQRTPHEASPADCPSVPDPKDRELRDGAELVALVIQAVRKLQESNEKRESFEQKTDQRFEAVQKTLASTLEAVSDVYAELSDTRQQRVGQSNSELLAEKTARWHLVEQHRTHERRLLWLLERRRSERADSDYVLPRPSIIGRALAELHDKTLDAAFTPADVFRRIQQRGEHHLSPAIIKALGRYRKPDGKIDTNVSGDFTKFLKHRVEGLVDAGYAIRTPGGIKLTPAGREIFEGWPAWDAHDDDIESGGYGPPRTGPTESGGLEAGVGDGKAAASQTVDGDRGA